MELHLAENIRALRRKHRMTQEHLAEALGVTAGAVYKWENERSTPDVGLLADMANLFDVSMDALLGYEMDGGDKEQVLARLREYARSRNVAHAASEAEKALKKYPNTFEVVYRCAVLYGVKSIDESSKRYARRALDLYRHALHLIDQNTDPEISTLSIQGHIAELYSQMGEDVKAVKLLKKNNPCHINSARIGELLAAGCDRPDEALPHLADGMLEYIMLLTELTQGYVNVFTKRKEYPMALQALSWSMDSIQGLKIPGKTSFLDKMHALYLLLCGEIYLYMGQEGEARAHLRRAKEMAQVFDTDPCYQCSRIRFIPSDEKSAVHDSMGATALEGLQRHVDEEGSAAFTALWEEIRNDGR